MRAFVFGPVRQLDRLTEQLLTRAWAAGAGPGDGPMTMTMDLDSTVCEVHDHETRAPPTATPHPRRASAARHPCRERRGAGCRQRTGRANTTRGTTRFVEELAARVRRAGASGS